MSARRPELVVIATTCALAAAALLYGLEPLSTYDIWWHLATGEQILATGSLLPTDPFSYTHAGVPWPYKDAGAALLLAAVHSLGGPGLLVWLKAAMFLATIAAIAAILVERRVPLGFGAILVALCIAALTFRFTERPAIFSFTLTAWLLWLLERHRRGRTSLLWAIPLCWVMANLHRGVLFAPLLVGAYVVVILYESRRQAPADMSRALRLPVIALCGCTVACFATPFGWNSLTQSMAILSSDAFRGAIPEWQSVSIGALWAATPATAVIGLLLGAGWIMTLRRGAADPWDVVLCILAVLAIVSGVRFIAYFTLLVVPVVGSQLAALPVPWDPRSRARVSLAAGVVAVFVALATGARAGGFADPIAERRYPEAALAFVRAEAATGALRGRMLNEFGLGGYLIYHLGPDFPVYVDGRNDLVYRAEFIARYPRVLTDPATFRAETDRWDVQWLFWHNRPDDAARAHIDADPGWSLVFASERGLIYVRRDGVNSDLAARRGYRFIQAHRPIVSVREAWVAADAEVRPQVLAEARRMVDEDPESIPALAALAQALGLAGEAYGSRAGELDAVLEKLVARGWAPPAK